MWKIFKIGDFPVRRSQRYDKRFDFARCARAEISFSTFRFLKFPIRKERPKNGILMRQSYVQSRKIPCFEVSPRLRNDQIFRDRLER